MKTFKQYIIVEAEYQGRDVPLGKKMKGDVGAKFMVKRLKNNTNFIKVLSKRVFKDLDLKKDFN